MADGLRLFLTTRSGSGFGFGCRLLEFIDIDLGHLQHGLHGAFRSLRILVAQQLAENGGDDLPGEVELVLQPAAAVGAATGGEFVPKFVHFLLGFAIYEERDGGRELELRAAVEGEEFLAFDLERHGHRGIFGSGPGVAVTGNLAHLRVLEDGDVEVGGFFGFAIEPEEWSDFLHRTILSVEIEFLLAAQEHRQECLCHKIVSDGGYCLPAARFLPTSLWWSIASLGAKSSNSKNWRISISLSSLEPWGAGTFLAQSTASCRDFTLIIQKPAISSLVSAKVPSMTEVLLPEKRTRKPFALDWSPARSTRTPAFTSSSLYLAIAARSSSLGILPASLSF